MVKSSETKGKKLMEIFSQYEKSFRINAHVDMLKELSTYIESLIKQNKELREELNSWNKDEKLQILQDEIKDMKNAAIYIRTENEIIEEAAFLSSHRLTCDGIVNYRFKGSNIGEWYELECQKCKTNKSIVDYENW